MSIRLEHISKSFGDFRALDDINLDFFDGELTALLGPSGSGKTTLLRLAAGLEVPDDVPGSRLSFNGRDVAREPVGRRQVGFVFQHYALFRHMTVFENVAFGLRVKRRAERPSKREIAERVHNLLHLVQLDTMAERLPNQLSGGQRQRVALARALAIQPRVLLLDEPFGALDAKVRSELRRWLRDLHDRLHITTVFVTHDQEEALEVADRVVVMNNGHVEQVGTPDEVFHQPASEFVLQFLGDVNVFHGRTGNGRADFTGPVQPGKENEARLMLRPHELALSPSPDGQHSFKACVQRVLTAGPIVKVDLLDNRNVRIQVHISHEEYREFPVETGHEVYIIPRCHRVYTTLNVEC